MIFMGVVTEKPDLGGVSGKTHVEGMLQQRSEG